VRGQARLAGSPQLRATDRLAPQKRRRIPALWLLLGLWAASSGYASASEPATTDDATSTADPFDREAAASTSEGSPPADPAPTGDSEDSASAPRSTDAPADDAEAQPSAGSPAPSKVPEGGTPQPAASPPKDATQPEPNKAKATATAAPPRLIRKRSVPPFWIDRDFTTHRTRALAFPPIFVHRTPKRGSPERLVHADLSFTFGWYSREKQRRRYINPFGLFFGGFSERKTTWAALPLLMGYRRVGEQFAFGQFPLVWWWGTKFVKNLVVAPFHYQQKSPDGYMGVSALLFWYGHKHLDDASLENDRRHFVAAPLFWRFQRGVKRFDFAFLYVGGRNQLKGSRYGAVVPFAFWRTNEFGNRKSVWTLAWIHRKDEARRRSAWAVPPLLTFEHRDPKRHVLSATPFFWRVKNHRKASTFTLAGPVGWYKDPKQSSTFVAPLYYRFRDLQAQATTHIILPLGWARKTPERTAVWTWLGGGRRTREGFGFAVPWLLTGATRRDDGTSLGVFGGLVWHAKQTGTATREHRNAWVVGPLGFFDRRGERRHLGLTPLLTFAGWGGGKHYQVLTPLFWHVRDREADKRTVVAGPFYHRKDKLGFDGGLAPVAFWGNNGKYRYGIVPWALTGHVTNLAEKTSLTISPLFVHGRGPDHRTIGVLGLAWDVKRTGERHTAVVPFFYRGKTPERTLVVTPLGGHVRRGDSITALYGLFARKKTKEVDGFGLFPLFYHNRRKVEGGWAKQTIVPPLFLHHRSPQQDLDMWTPLVWRSNVRGERPRKGLAVVPFYFRQRQPGGVDVDASLGFFWSRDKRRRTHTLIVGPGFHRLSRTQLNAGIFPIYWWMDAKDKRRLIALPIIVHVAKKDKREHTTIAFPLWFDRQRADKRRTWAAFPFVFGGRRGHNFTRVSAVPIGYFDIFRLKRNTRFTGFVPLLFRFDRCGYKRGDDPSCRYRLWGSFPFFLYGKDGQGRTTHAAALLYYWDKTKQGYKLYTPLFGVRNEPGKTFGWYATIVGAKTTNTHQRVFAFPFYYRKAHRLQDENLTLVLPPLFIGRHRKDRSFFEAGLVVWQFRQQHKVSTAVVPPIFFYSHAYAQRKLLWVAPFFIRDHQISNDLAWTAVPVLYTQRRKGEDLDFVQFPLVWHIERGENQGTMGAFVWWDIRVKGKIVQTVPVLYTRVATPELDTRVIGPGLGWWTRGRGVREGDHGWRILLGLLGAGVENGRRYFALFGRKIDRGPESPAAAERYRMRQAKRDARAASRSREATARFDRMLERQAERDDAGRRRNDAELERLRLRALAREQRLSARERSRQLPAAGARPKTRN